MLDFDFQGISQLIIDTDIQTFTVILLSIMWIGFLVNHYFKNKHKYALAEKIPGPPTLPLIGNAHIFMGLDMTGELFV